MCVREKESLALKSLQPTGHPKMQGLYQQFVIVGGYCIVLYCIVLYFTVLYCTVLYCTVLYCIVLQEERFSCSPSVTLARSLSRTVHAPHVSSHRQGYNRIGTLCAPCTVGWSSTEPIVLPPGW